MNIAFDPGEWSVACPDEAVRADCAHPEWHALRARFHAALEAREALDRGRLAGAARTFGSFSRRAAVSLERVSRRFEPVNQTSSVNRKRDRGTIPHVADVSKFGGRG